MIKETLPVAIEKELLARRVAELEHRLATSEEGVRTAKRPNGKKVAGSFELRLETLGPGANPSPRDRGGGPAEPLFQSAA